ncbi:hypothetical protein [Sphaerisporangium corydalis]|uniref:Uncharacterized protein n=1 Tax=Sphaerisporangium corydalis TaxID=1441875 RepID=A0ABV9ES02_9ACTN|nr:hypothetical protein [Sphaerisporangium corydalis]
MHDMLKSMLGHSLEGPSQEFATYAYFCATLEKVFTNDLTADRVRGSDIFDDLAAAQCAFDRHAARLTIYLHHPAKLEPDGIGSARLSMSRFYRTSTTNRQVQQQGRPTPHTDVRYHTPEQGE